MSELKFATRLGLEGQVLGHPVRTCQVSFPLLASRMLDGKGLSPGPCDKQVAQWLSRLATC